jgi:hypothetical protein
MLLDLYIHVFSVCQEDLHTIVSLVVTCKVHRWLGLVCLGRPQSCSIQGRGCSASLTMVALASISEVYSPMLATRYALRSSALCVQRLCRAQLSTRCLAATVPHCAALGHSAWRPDVAPAGSVSNLKRNIGISCAAEMTIPAEGSRLEHSSYANARSIRVVHNDFDLDVSFELKTISGAATVTEAAQYVGMISLNVTMLCCECTTWMRPARRSP